jgi:hypothetical protein
MATIHTLKTQYSAVMRIDYGAISAADSTLLADLAAKVDSAAITLSTATAEITKLAINTTTVANLSYYFFTGATPLARGLDYLISPSGGNTHNLNSTYYQTFNMENRFINFAVNLGKGGEGAAGFSTAYGGLSMTEATTKAYTTIFGFAPPAGRIAEILDAQVPNGVGGTYSRAQYFAAIGQDGATGQGTKAAMVGWLLAEAAKAGLGAYVSANNAFLADLVDDGLADFNVDLLGAYGDRSAASPGAAITVTAGQSVSQDAANSALRSTNGDDTVTGANGLNAQQSIHTGDGHDRITLTGEVQGLIDTGAGDDVVVLQSLARVTVLGAPDSGIVRLGAGNDNITVSDGVGAGAVIDGGAGIDTLTTMTLHSTATLNSVEHLVITGLPGGATPPTGSSPPTLEAVVDLNRAAGLRDVFNVAQSYTTLTVKNASTDIVAGLRDSWGSLKVEYASGVADGRIQLDNVQNPQSLGGVYSNSVSVSGLTGTLRLNVVSDSAVGEVVVRDGKGLTITGDGDFSARVVTLGSTVAGFPPFDVAPAIAHRLDASAAASVNIGSFAPGALDTVVVLSGGNDVFGAYLYAQTRTTITLGGGADVLKIVTASPPVGGPAPAFANLRVTGDKIDTYATVTDFQKGVDQLDLGALMPNVAKVATGAGTTLEQVLINVSAGVAANSAAVFEFGGDTYVYRQDATVGVNTGDGLIKLVGVTGLTLATGAATGDIHYG